MAITIEMIKELREATGAGVLDAKKALESTGGDFEQALQLLHEKGLARAAKRADREVTEGRVEARSQDTQVGLLVEVNCETDFVGKTDKFVAFAQDIADHFFALAGTEQPLEAVMSLPFFKDRSVTPQEMLQQVISATGENMAVRRFERYELNSRLGVIEVYPHPGNRVAVMVELNSETAAGAARPAFAELAHDLALHVAASAPNYVTRDDIPSEILEGETAQYRKQALDEGKPEKIVERIVEGRLKKYYEAVVLMEQPFVKDDTITVGQLLQEKNVALGEQVTVRRFVRFELGEPLE